MDRDWYFVRVILFSAVGWLLLYALAWGQATDITVDITKARIVWAWTQGTGGVVEKWLIRCGPTSTNYNILVELATPAARSVPIQQITPDVGTYFCVVAATNTFGTSGPSNEVTYQAGKAPGPATALKIEAQ